MSTALILFGSMAVFLIIGVPIAFALGASVWATIVFSPDFTVTTGIIAQRIFGGLESAVSQNVWLILRTASSGAYAAVWRWRWYSHLLSSRRFQDPHRPL